MMHGATELMDRDFFDADFFLRTNRRDFLKITGGGLFVFFNAGESAEAQERRQGLPNDFNAFLQIGEDGRVRCTTGKIEMGQGIITSLAQMAADELCVPLAAVDMIMGDTDLCPWDQGTHGSMTTRFFGPPLRAAAAEARGVLLELAAELLKIPVHRLKTNDGEIFDTENTKSRVTYAALTKGKKIARRLKDKPVIKTVQDFSIVGKPVQRMDAEAKVTGKAKFTGDITIPGLQYAKILRPPAHGAVLKNVDVSAIEKAEGIRLVRDGDLVAVLAEDIELAEAALAKIKPQYDIPEVIVDDKSIFDYLLKKASGGDPVAKGGIIADGEKIAVVTAEKTYLNSYVAHAPIEPHIAIAQPDGDKITVWASTQSPFGVRSEIARTLGYTEQNVHVITPFVGGGFGGKGRNQQAVEAARIAKLSGKPVKVAWTREEEFFYDTFRPAAIVKIKAGVSSTGQITFWDYGVYFAGQRGAEHFYDIPNHRTVVYGGGSGAHPFGTGAWRAPANNTNTFARESHIDILANETGADPFEFRLKNLKDSRMIRVLKAAGEKFGWTPAKSPSGRGYGIALGIDSGTYVALIAEVKVDKGNGNVQVKRVVCAQDMGFCINPEGAKLQMEGCITMGMGYALTEEIHFKGGNVLDRNFNTYEIPRFSWLPKIETVLVGEKEMPAQGGGEPSIICMGAVIANAVFDAAGARVLQLPLTPERIRKPL